MKVIVACESSGVVREAFRKRGHDAWSCDLLPADDGSPYHFQADALDIIYDESHNWDLMIAHPPCTRLANSGVRWLTKPPKGKTLEQIWQELEEGVDFYKAIKNAPIPMKCIENPIMHKHAKERLGKIDRQVVQPWWFGEEAFKATGFELINLPNLEASDKLDPPVKGSEEHKAWSWIHLLPPSPDRWKLRSRTFEGIAEAMATQWGDL